MQHPLFQVVGPFVLGLVGLGVAKTFAMAVQRFLAQQMRVERAEEREFKEAESIRAELRMERDALKKECQQLREEISYWRQRVLALWDEANRCRQRDGLAPLPEEKVPPPMRPPWEGETG